MKKLLNSLRKRAGINTLLSAANSNPKVAKNGTLGMLTGVLHLAPGNMSGHEVCPKRSPGCTAACLHFAGSPAYMTGKTQARIKKTKLFFSDRNLFMNILALEMEQHLLLAASQNFEPSFRLNATSDILWETKKFIMFPEVSAALGRSGSTILDVFPNTSFYDYTAVPNRKVPENYDLTFSMKETNDNDVTNAFSQGLNVAVVFEKKLPKTFRIAGKDVPVINGDEHDYRPVDSRRVVVGLKAKGSKGRKDISGFVNPLHGNGYPPQAALAA